MTKEYGTPGPRAIHLDVAHSRSLRQTGSLLAMLLFDRLVACADDQGRLSGDAYDLRVACMANALDLCTVDDVQAALEALQGVGMVTLYQVADQPYLQLTRWWQWQGGTRRAYPLRHPAPPDWEDHVYGQWTAAEQHTNGAATPELPQTAAASGRLPRPAVRAHVQPSPALPLPAQPSRRAHARKAAANGALADPDGPARLGAADLSPTMQALLARDAAKDVH